MMQLEGNLGWRLNAVVLCVSITVGLFALRDSWIEQRALPGQFQRGYFEEHLGRVGLTLDISHGDPFFPNLNLRHDRKIDLPPGTSVALPLEPGAEYRISRSRGSPAVYSVVGITSKDVTPATDHRRLPDEGRSAPVWLAEALTLDVDDSELVFRTWDASAPYRDDERRLRRMSQACLDPTAAEPQTVVVHRDRIHIQLGRCALDAALRLGPENQPRVLALIAGKQWHSIESRNGGFRVQRQLAWSALGSALLSSVLVTLLLAFSLGIPTAVAVAVSFAVASFLIHPLLVPLLFQLAGFLAVVVVPVRMVVALVPPNRLALRAGLIVLAYGGFALVGVSILRSSAHEDVAILARDLQTTGPDHECLLAGYSTAADYHIRPGTAGTWRYLTEDCARCRAGVMRYGRPGATFVFIQPLACATESPLKPSEQFLFLGGTNDDFYYSLRGTLSVASVLDRSSTIARGLYYLEHPSIDRLRRFMNESAHASRFVLEEQAQSIRETAQCVAERGAEFWYFQDFMILDLAEERLPERRQMLERRRTEVMEAGGTFVDLLSAFNSEVGVSWFNDLIHLSSIGHRHVAQLICNSITSGSLSMRDENG